MARWLRCLRLLALLWLCQGGLPAVAAAPGTPLQLDDRVAAIDAWPAVTVLADEGGTMALDEALALARSGAFDVPAGPHANLGVRPGATWLRVPLQVQGRGRWVLEIDYPALNRVEVHLLSGSRPLGSDRLGNDQPFEQRPLKTRAHALALELGDGQSYELLMRVQSSSTQVLPLALYRADAFYPHESGRQLMQGLLLGIALALLLYSVGSAISLRDPLFTQYAVMLLGVGLFFVSYTGIGQQYLWPQQTGQLAKLAPMGALLALAGGSLFVCGALQMPVRHPRVTLGLRVIAGLAGGTLLLSLAGAIDYRATQTVATALGPMPMLVAVHAAVLQARQGDRAARLMLVGWAAYLVGALSMAGLLRGWVPANFWTLHLFQFTSVVEMVAWIRVLGLRIEEVQRAAERGEVERNALRSLANTDPLTGLPNRRGLQLSLAAALHNLRAGDGLAVFMLDLDGFKPVNDTLGHDVGDLLLVQVAQRLRQLVRAGDIVTRLGGDEFVVVGIGMSRDADAAALGHKLLEAFRQPFEVGARHCQVGLTVGYALAPQDGSDAAALIKQADAAMYAGKQGGRHCLRRAGPLPVLMTQPGH